MKDKIFTTLKWLAAAAAMTAIFSYAASSDYQDAVIQDMKNNGAYYTISTQHPDWSEAEMVTYYNEQRNKPNK